MKRLHLIAILVTSVILIAVLTYVLTRKKTPSIQGELSIRNNTTVSSDIREGDEIEILFDAVTGIDGILPTDVHWFRHNSKSAQGVRLEWSAETVVSIPQDFCVDKSTNAYLSVSVTWDDVTLTSPIYTVLAQDDLPVVSIVGEAIIGQTLSYELTDKDTYSAYGDVGVVWSSDELGVGVEGSDDTLLIRMDYVPELTVNRRLYIKVSYTDNQGYVNSASTSVLVQTLPQGKLIVADTSGNVLTEYNEGLSVQINTDEVFVTESIQSITEIEWFQYNSLAASVGELRADLSGKTVLSIPQNFISGDADDSFLQVFAKITDVVGDRVLQSDRIRILKSNVDPLNIPIMTISGTLKEGETVTADVGDLSQITDDDGVPVTLHNIVWEVETGQNTNLYEESLAGPTSFTIAKDFGLKRLRFKAELKDQQNHSFYAYSDASEVEIVDDYAPTAQVVLNPQVVKEGDTIEANLVNVQDADQVETFEIVQYTWEARVTTVDENDANWQVVAESATASTYVISPDFGARQLRCVLLIESNPFGSQYSFESSPVNVSVSNSNDSVLSIEGSMTEGSEVSFLIEDADGDTTVSAIQWARDAQFTDIVSELSTYIIPLDYVTDTVSNLYLRVTYVDAQTFESTLETSREVVKVNNEDATGSPTFVINAWTVGETLSVDTSTIQDADGLSLSFQFKYITGDDVLSNDDTYTIPSNLLGKTIRCEVTATDSQGYSTVLSIDPSPLISEGIDIVGDPIEGGTLTVNTDAFTDNAVSFTYTWSDNNGNLLDTSQSYEIPLAYGQKDLRVLVVASKDGSEIGRWERTLSVVYGNQVNPTPLAFTLESVFAEGEVVTIDWSSVDDDDGGLKLDTASYTWLINGLLYTPVEETTGPSLTLPYIISSHTSEGTLQCQVAVEDGEGHLNELSTGVKYITNTDREPAGTLRFDVTPVDENTVLKIDTTSVTDDDGGLLWDKAVCNWYKNDDSTLNENATLLGRNLGVNDGFQFDNFFSSAGKNNTVIVQVSVSDGEGNSYFLTAQATVEDQDRAVVGTLTLVSTNLFKEQSTISVDQSSVSDDDDLDWGSATYIWYKNTIGNDYQIQDEDGNPFTGNSYIPPYNFVEGNETTKLICEVNVMDTNGHTNILFASAEIVQGDRLYTGILTLFVETASQDKTENVKYIVNTANVNDPDGPNPDPTQNLNWAEATFSWYKNTYAEDNFLQSTTLGEYTPDYTFSTASATNKLLVRATVSDFGGTTYTLDAEAEVAHVNRDAHDTGTLYNVTNEYDTDFREGQTYRVDQTSLSDPDGLTDLSSATYKWYKDLISESEVLGDSETYKVPYGFSASTGVSKLICVVSVADDQGSLEKIEISQDIRHVAFKIVEAGNSTKPSQYDEGMTLTVASEFSEDSSNFKWDTAAVKWYETGDSESPYWTALQWEVPYNVAPLDGTRSVTCSLTIKDMEDDEYTGLLTTFVLNYKDRPMTYDGVELDNATVVPIVKGIDNSVPDVYAEGVSYTVDLTKLGDLDGVQSSYSYSWYSAASKDQDSDAWSPEANTAEYKPGYDFSTDGSLRWLVCQITAKDNRGQTYTFITQKVEIAHVDFAIVDSDLPSVPDSYLEGMTLKIDESSLYTYYGNLNWGNADVKWSDLSDDPVISSGKTWSVPYTLNLNESQVVTCSLTIRDEQEQTYTLSKTFTVLYLDRPMTYNGEIIKDNIVPIVTAVAKTMPDDYEEGVEYTVDFDGINDEDGVDSESWTYTWIRIKKEGETEISEEMGTDSTYTPDYTFSLGPTNEPVDNELYCQISVTDQRGKVYTFKSQKVVIKHVDQPIVTAFKIVDKNGNVPSQYNEGMTLTLDTSTDSITDPDGLNWDSANVRWFKTGNSGTNENEGLTWTVPYSIAPVDQLQNVTCELTIEDNQFEVYTRYTTFDVHYVDQPIDNANFKIKKYLDESIPQSFYEGTKYMVDVNDVTDADGVDTETASYQWYKINEEDSNEHLIEGATSYTYTPDNTFSIGPEGSPINNKLLCKMTVSDTRGKEYEIDTDAVVIQHVDEAPIGYILIKLAGTNEIPDRYLFNMDLKVDEEAIKDPDNLKWDETAEVKWTFKDIGNIVTSGMTINAWDIYSTALSTKDKCDVSVEVKIYDEQGAFYTFNLDNFTMYHHIPKLNMNTTQFTCKQYFNTSSVQELDTNWTVLNLPIGPGILFPNFGTRTLITTFQKTSTVEIDTWEMQVTGVNHLTDNTLDYSRNLIGTSDVFKIESDGKLYLDKKDNSTIVPPLRYTLAITVGNNGNSQTYEGIIVDVLLHYKPYLTQWTKAWSDGNIYTTTGYFAWGYMSGQANNTRPTLHSDRAILPVMKNRKIHIDFRLGRMKGSRLEMRIRKLPPVSSNGNSTALDYPDNGMFIALTAGASGHNSYVADYQSGSQQTNLTWSTDVNIGSTWDRRDGSPMDIIYEYRRIEITNSGTEISTVNFYGRSTNELYDSFGWNPLRYGLTGESKPILQVNLYNTGWYVLEFSDTNTSYGDVKIDNLVIEQFNN